MTWTRDDDLNYSMLAFEDEASGDSFAIQRALSFDDQDRQLGMNTYCLVRGAATYYGGVDEFGAAETKVHLRLTADAADALELPRNVRLPIDPNQADLVRTRLPELVNHDG